MKRPWALPNLLANHFFYFFTGSDWCSWCNKLEEEVFDDPEFAQAAADQFIFLKLDFPLNTSLPANLAAQNKQLQKKFDIRSFPTVILIDANYQQQIGTTGYRAGGGKQYATHLFGMVNDYAGYKGKMRSLGQQKLSSADLRQLYEKAKALSLDNDARLVLRIGMETEDNLFFLTEQYRFLVGEGQIAGQEAVALKLQLLNGDPQNLRKTHYHLAVIDFEAGYENSEREDLSADALVAPLLQYIERFGAQDKENLWRLQMIISQVYFDKSRLTDSLRYAKQAYLSAPASVQSEIAMAIKNIEMQLPAS